MLRRRGNNDEKAEEYFTRAIRVDPTYATNLCNYALFLETIRKDYDLAEKHYKLALELNPKDLKSVNNYSIFLRTIRKDEAAAKRIDAMKKDAR